MYKGRRQVWRYNDCTKGIQTAYERNQFGGRSWTKHRRRRLVCRLCIDSGKQLKATWYINPSNLLPSHLIPSYLIYPPQQASKLSLPSTLNPLPIHSPPLLSSLPLTSSPPHPSHRSSFPKHLIQQSTPPPKTPSSPSPPAPLSIPPTPPFPFPFHSSSPTPSLRVANGRGR